LELGFSGGALGLASVALGCNLGEQEGLKAAFSTANVSGLQEGSACMPTSFVQRVALSRGCDGRLT
jgi:hypothetical protein